MTDFKQKQVSVIPWKASGGSAALTLNALANGAGRKGGGWDFGATFPNRAHIQLATATTAAPTNGTTIQVAWSSSMDNTTFDGNTAAGDAAMSSASLFRQMHLAGVLPLDNATTKQVGSWVFFIPARYGFPVVWNASGQALPTTSSLHVLTITTLVDTDT